MKIGYPINTVFVFIKKIKNFNIATKEVDNKVVFLRKLVEGGSQHSFGIHVAKMASMPNKIVYRAAQILIELEQKSIGVEPSETLKNMAQPSVYQLNMFQPTVDAGLLKELDTMNVETMTPVECMMKLIELQKLHRK